MTDFDMLAEDFVLDYTSKEAVRNFLDGSEGNFYDGEEGIILPMEMEATGLHPALSETPGRAYYDDQLVDGDPLMDPSLQVSALVADHHEQLETAINGALENQEVLIPPPNAQPEADDSLPSVSLLRADLVNCNCEIDNLADSLWRFKNGPADAFQSLATNVEELKARVTSILESSENVIDNRYLNPTDLGLWGKLNGECDIRLRQLALFESDLKAANSGITPNSMDLIICSQPFPTSIFVKRPVENLAVKLLTGAMTSSMIKGIKVSADILTDSKNMTCSGSTGELDENGVLVFENLRFAKGSTLKIVNLRIYVNSSSLEVTTEPFIVKSNEGQWYNSERIILEEMLFNSKKKIPRVRFCNLLQKWYISATKQNFDAHCVPLTREDFDYFFTNKFGSKNEISIYEFKNFWTWFGPIMHKVRYQSKLKEMWTRGIVAGFLDRATSEMLLTPEQPGTFVIRVSEETPPDGFQGLVISYRTANTGGGATVNHYLAKDNDVNAKSKSIADFVQEHQFLTTILEKHIDPITQERTILRSNKDTALEAYYNNRLATHCPQGYVNYIG